MTGSAHAVYAPSSAHRWAHCTASATAVAALGEQEEGEEAAEGTRAHDEIERCLGPLSDIYVDQGDFEAGSLRVNSGHSAAYGVALVLDYVRQLVTLTPGTLWIEQRVRLTNEIWGRCDVAHWDDVAKVLTIVDYKNGYVNVEAEANEQLMIYAAASIYTHQLPAQWVRLVVVQPNSWMPVPRVKQWSVSAGDLYAFANRVAAIPTGPLEFRAGEHCRYCPAFGQCPASQDVLAELATMLVNPPDAVPAHQVAKFKACEKPISDWFKALDKDQTSRALKGHMAPGMKLVQTTRHREWIDEGAARAAIVAAHGVDALKPPTPAQAAKLGDVDVDALSRQPEGGPALAFESDRRKPWVPKSAQEMFGDTVAAMEAAE